MTLTTRVLGNRSSRLYPPIQAQHVAPAPLAATIFGQFRVAGTYRLFDATQKYNLDPIEFGTQTATGATVTHNAAHSAARLTTTAAAGSLARIRTNTFFRYQTGKELAISLVVLNENAGVANQRRAWGYFDDSDGVFFELSGTALRIVLRSSASGVVVDTPIAQASWNYDVMDGSGPSGVVLNLTVGNLYEIRVGVGEVSVFINGFLVHTITVENGGAFFRTLHLPIQCEIENTGAAAVAWIEQISASVNVYSGSDPPQYAFSASNDTPIGANATGRPILSIRPALTFNGITNRMLMLPSVMEISNEINRAGFYLILNGTLTGAAFAAVNANSGMEFDVAATAVTGGEVIYRGFLPNNNDTAVRELTDFFKLYARMLRLGAFSGRDVLTIFARNEVSGGMGNSDVRASITWSEIR